MAKKLKGIRLEGKDIAVVTGEMLEDMYNKGQIDFDLEVLDSIKAQRNFIWDRNMCSALIETCLNKKEAPVIYFVKNKNGSYSVIDGQQRIKAYLQYLFGEYKLSKSAKDVDFEEVYNKKFEQLPESLQKKLLKYSFTIIIYDEMDDERIVETFNTFNIGIKLNVIERLRGELGKQVKFLEEMVKHDMFNIATLNKNRMQDQDLALCLLMLEVNPRYGLSKAEKEDYVSKVKDTDGYNQKFKDGLYEKLDYLNEAFNRDEYKKGKERYFKKGLAPIFFLALRKAYALKLSPEEFFDTFNDVLCVNRVKTNTLVMAMATNSTTSRSAIDAKLVEIEKALEKKAKQINKGK